MIAGISPDKIDLILDPQKDESEDAKHLNRQWVKFFVIFGGFTIAVASLLIYRLMTQTGSPASLCVTLLLTLIMDAYVLSRFIRTRVILPNRYKAAIAKYGREELRAQLSDSAAFGFFVDAGEYGNLAILTLDYFIGESEFIIALKDIQAMTVRKHDINEEGVRKVKSEHNRNVLHCAYSADITFTNGSRRRVLFAMTTPDLNAFLGYIQQRAPHIKIAYR